MEFRKQKRNAKVLLLEEWCFWRLASVDEVKRNMETIKQEQILESWDICRLLDGWVCGPGYRYELQNGYKDMGDMLLVKTPERRSRHGEFTEGMYRGVQLNSERLKYALLLSCQDKIPEVMCFVLKSTIDKFQDEGERQAELDRFTESLKETFNQRRTVLHYAADQPYNETHARCVAELILRYFEYGKELIKASDKYGRTALHLAALHGYVELCTFLMSECGLKADKKDRNGENVLHLVANGDNIYGLVSLLQIEEVKSLIASQDGKGKTPLHKAAANGDTRFIGALVGIAGVRSEEYVRQADLFGQMALHEAASGGHKEAVMNLLTMGSRPLLERNSEGKTALHYCVQIPDQKRAKDIAEVLLQHCASGEERLLLLWASATGMGTAEQSAESSSTIHCFLKQNRNNETKAESSSDLLLSAVKLGYDALAWELINRGANTSQLHNFSKTDLSHAHRQRVHKYRQSSDVENPHKYLPQKVQQSGPENRLIISQFMKYFKALRCWICGWIYSGQHMRSSKLESVPINSQLILPSYSDEERKAMVFLSTQASDGPQLPREWKRFLTYHRLAWNILFRLQQVKNLAGWQVQLLVWIFCCWQWKDNINLIIKKWKELVSMKGGTVNDEDPSLKIIVEHCRDKFNESAVENDKWDLLIKTLDKYDVTMESIQSFQKFRLHCEIGYLPRPPATDTANEQHLC